MEITFPARCPQIMLLKQCIRRAVQEGLKIYIQVLTRFFFPFPIQSIPAKPALLTCPAASEGAAPGGPEIDVSEVIKRNLERTRSQEGWSAVSYIYIYMLSIIDI